MRIVLVRNQVMVTKVINLILSDAGHDVIVSRTGREGIDAVVGTETDAVVLEVDLPDMDGFHLCKELRAVRYHGPILFVTPRQQLEDKLKAFNHGADDYLVEPFEPAELLARVEATARRCRQLDQQALGTVIKVGDAELSIGDLTFQIDGREPVLLTPTEMRLLERLMRNAGITISRETLIERTWGYDYFGDSNRVDVYVARLRKKIELDPARPAYLHTVRGSGYVFRPPVSPQAQQDIVHSEEPIPAGLLNTNSSFATVR